MTRKHFEAIAAIIKNTLVTDRREATATAMADYLATQNPNFDRGRFLTACGCES